MSDQPTTVADNQKIGKQPDWKDPSAVAAFLAGEIASFLHLPAAVLTSEGSTFSLQFARGFVIPVFCYVTLALGRAFHLRKHMGWWIISTVISFTVATIIWTSYTLNVSNWTRKTKAGVEFLWGSEYTDRAINGRIAVHKLKQEPPIDRKAAIKELDGESKADLVDNTDEKDPSLIWTPESIQRRRSVLLILYVLAIPFMVVGVVCARQSWLCSAPTTE